MGIEAAVKLINEWVATIEQRIKNGEKIKDRALLIDIHDLQKLFTALAWEEDLIVEPNKIIVNSNDATRWFNAYCLERDELVKLKKEYIPREWLVPLLEALETTKKIRDTDEAASILEQVIKAVLKDAGLI